MKTMYAARDFNDAGTGRRFVRGETISDVTDGQMENYAAASLVTDEEPAAAKAAEGTTFETPSTPAPAAAPQAEDAPAAALVENADAATDGAEIDGAAAQAASPLFEEAGDPPAAPQADDADAATAEVEPQAASDADAEPAPSKPARRKKAAEA